MCRRRDVRGIRHGRDCRGTTGGCRDPVPHHHKGDHLDVQLSVPSGFIWTEPASSDQSVLHRTGGSSGSTATGTFVAKSKGKVEVTAIGKPKCSASPCPALLLLFQVNVSVVS